MRPLTLELEGFASFRSPTTIDFRDADLFVLSGPTGAGKSSIIDAMTFALYGTVARYDRRSVEPVITKGRNEARVRLDFVANRRRHTAVRVVRRQRNGGASTAEARLERWRGDDPSDTHVLAGTAADVTRAVGDLLGLGFEHFTRTIVLPQGEFQEFLHARGADRIDLVQQLLDIRIYDQVAQAARIRATSLGGRLQALEARLQGDLAEVDQDELDRADARVATLAAAVATIEREREAVDAILVAGREQAQAVERLGTQLAQVNGIAPPAGLDDLVEAATAAAARLAAATEAVAEAAAARDRADAAVDDLPSPDAITAHRRLLDRVTTLASRADQQRAEAHEAALALESAESAVRDATTRHQAAAAALDEARRRDLVATLTHDLARGDDCPVCARPLDEVPRAHDDALHTAGAAHDQASAGLEAARSAAATAHQAATTARAAVDGTTKVRREALAELDATSLPRELPALGQLTARVDAAWGQRREARAAIVTAQEALLAATAAADQVRSRESTARRALQQARDAVADQRPPALDADDLAGAWTALVAWLAQRRDDLEAAVGAATTARDAARDQYLSALGALRSGLDAPGVDLQGATTPDALRDRCVEARHVATTQRDRLQQRRHDRAQLQEERTGLRRDQRVATDLGRLLDRRNFQRWMTARALRLLVQRATVHLRTLTRDAYSLTLDDQDEFAVVDHGNADEHRPARSLSGGETFLASLSLALALSESIQDLAAQGAARLDSLFIDEGFGTLDASTIDVVRTALEELGSAGRMVGIVTHVPALAEQLPVQFRVRKEAQTSIVERVDR